MEIIRIQHKGNGISQSDRKPMWLAWIGQEMPSLFEIWQLYLRRFAIEHWNRFAKQRLHWTKAKWGTPQKEEKWSDWDSGKISKTPWKVSRLEKRSKKAA